METTVPQLHPAIQRYLTALSASLKKTPGVVPEEGLADAQEYLLSEWESLRRQRPNCSEDFLFRHFVAKFGSPADVAAGYTATLEAPAAAESGQASAASLAVADLPVQDDRSSRGRSRRILLAVAGLAALLAAGWLLAQWAVRNGNSSAADAAPVWADRVVSFTRGAGESVRSSEPSAALGLPDCQDGDRDDHTYVSLGLGGELILGFSGARFRDGPGPDLKIVEIGPLAEAVDVAVSGDGQTWIEVGRAKGAEATIDLAPYVRSSDSFCLVRLIDVQSVRNPKNNWPGADIDAVGALHVVVGK